MTTELDTMAKTVAAPINAAWVTGGSRTRVDPEGAEGK